MRDHNAEFQDNERKYSYDFDTILRDYMLRTFDPLLIQGAALELGCFQGDFTVLIKKKFTDLTVIEASDQLIEVAKKRCSSVKFVHSTFENYSTDKKYDTIFLVHTLEHLDDPTAVLKKINTWLSPQGRLFLAVPNANAPSRQIAVKMGLITHNTAVTDAEQKHGHRCTYALDTLEKEVLKSGLNIVSRGGIFFKPLANYQLDQCLANNIINQDFLDGCYKLGMVYPDLCATIYLVCSKGQTA